MSRDAPDADFAKRLVELLPRLRRYATVLTGDRHAADDLVQDTIERGWTRHEQWQAGTDLRAWLFSIMHNRRIDLLRAQPSGLDEIDDEIAAPESGLGHAMGGAIEAIDIQRAFERLSLAHREVMLLVAVEQLSYDDAAAAIGVPLGTVMSRLSRARANLRALLDAPQASRAAERGAAPPSAHLSRVK